MDKNPVDYTLLNTLYPKVETAFADKTNVNKLIRGIRSYADKWSDLLLSTDMSKRLLFSDYDKSIINLATGIKESEVAAAIRKSPTIKSNWKSATNPFYVLCVIIARYFELHNMKAENTAITVYLAYNLYTSAHASSFKYLPNKQIMDYTINNLNNRFILKQTGTIQGMLEYTVTGAMDNRYAEELKNCSDDDIKSIITALDTRVASSVKNIATLFYENHKNGNYLFHEDDDESEENFHLSDNISFKIDRVVQLVSSSIISSGFDYRTCVQRSANLNSGVSVKKLDSMLNTIVENDMKSISPFISDVLTLFIYKGTGTKIDQLGTMKFISEAMQIYKSNAQDDITNRVKDKLLDWINMTSEKYGRNFISKGKTSLDNYRRAIYTAFVFKISESVK